jgi:uncharacterized protein with LGFP repeats
VKADTSSPVTTTPNGNGQSTPFGGASHYYSAASGVHTIQGAIRDKWLALGGTQTLGFPVTDENTTATNTVATGLAERGLPQRRREPR